MNSKPEQPSWLIRDNRNVIRGPVTNAEILQLLKKGNLKGKTEICCANNYWFGVDEKTELAKFFPELSGGKVAQPENATQMTATLVDHNQGEAESKLDHTQFITAEQKDSLPISSQSTNNMQDQIEWLSDEFADEFGVDVADNVATVKAEIKSKDFSKRTSSKDDALPSEMKGSVGERPKPFSLKNQDKNNSQLANTNTVSVPVAQTESLIKITDPAKEAQEEAMDGRRKINIFIGTLIVFLMIGSILFYFKFEKNSGKVGVKNPTAAKSLKKKLPPQMAIQRAFLLYDLEGSKEALNELEQSAKGNVIVPISQAIFRKEFLFDPETALSALVTAKGLSDSAEIEKSLDNLTAMYTFERDRAFAINLFKKLIEDSSVSIVYKYNLALAYLRNSKWQEAGLLASSLLPSARNNAELSSRLNLVVGWSKELTGTSDTSSEAAFQRSLEQNPFSPKAHLGLAINKLRRKGLRESESEFKAFIESLPEMDGPDRITNFQRMNDFDIYNFARAQIRELNVPGGSVGSKPSPLIMAVDAVLSCLQNRQGEAGKILENALSAAPGDITLLKAVGYHRWREARYDEIIDLLKDQNKDKDGFAVNYLLARSYERTGKKDLEEKHIRVLTESAAERSDSWSQLGSFKLRQGDNAGAKEAFQAALEKDSMDLGALRGMDALGENQDILSSEFKDFLPF